MSRILRNVNEIIPTSTDALTVVSTNGINIPVGDTSTHRGFLFTSNSSITLPANLVGNVTFAFDLNDNASSKIEVGTLIPVWYLNNPRYFLFGEVVDVNNQAPFTITVQVEQAKVVSGVHGFFGDGLPHSLWGVGSWIGLGSIRYNSDTAKRGIELFVETTNLNSIQGYSSTGKKGGWFLLSDINGTGLSPSIGGIVINGDPNQIVTTYDMGGNITVGATTPFKLNPGGNAAAPAYSFVNDSDTGIYNGSANTLNFSANGQNIFKLDPTGVAIQNGFLVKTTANSVIAAGSLQSNATVLTTDLNVVTSSGPNTGVRLPSASTGMEIAVWNNTVNAINVYPATGATINALAVNLPDILYPNFRKVYSAVSTTAWGTPQNIATQQAAGQISASDKLRLDSSPITAGFRNAIINGRFDLWQRGTSLPNGTGIRYIADRFSCESSGSTVAGIQQIFTTGQTAVPYEPLYFLRTTVTSVAGNNNYGRVTYRVEDVRSFANQTVTLSFYAKTDSPRNIAIEFLQQFGTGGSPSAVVTGIGVTTCALTTVWQKYTITVTIPSISGQTIGTDLNSSYLGINWFVDAGSNLGVRTNNLPQQSGILDLAMVQLEPGAYATPMEPRPLLLEFNLAARYYTILAASNVFYGTAGASTRHSMTIPMPLRINTPSVTWVNGTLVNVSTLSATADSRTAYVNVTPTGTGNFDFTTNIFIHADY